MPRPPHLCTCGRTIPYNTICICKRAAIRARNKRHDANRPNARQRGYNREWQAARKEWLRYHPDCNHPGCTAQANVVDHIKPHRGDEKLFWDWRNWQSLCTHHHNAHKQRTERAERDQ